MISLISLIMEQNITESTQATVNHSETIQNGFDFTLLILVCFIVGLFKILKLMKRIISPLIKKRLNLYERYGGGWALITGGSEGIGYAIAEQLARCGFNLFIVSRSSKKLETAKNKLLQINSSISVEVQSVDFQKITTESQYRSAVCQIIKKDVSLLVNNVGYYLPHKFANNSFEDVSREMKINCLPIAVLTRIFLETMMKRQKRSGIINLSSSAATSVFSGCAHYSSTKIFDDFFSQIIGEEYANKIDVLTVRPFLVTTPMTNNVESPLHITAAKCGKAIVDQLGNESVCYGPLQHQIQGGLVELVPECVSGLVFSESMKQIQKTFDKQN